MFSSLIQILIIHSRLQSANSVHVTWEGYKALAKAMAGAMEDKSFTIGWSPRPHNRPREAVAGGQMQKNVRVASWVSNDEAVARGGKGAWRPRGSTFRGRARGQQGKRGRKERLSEIFHAQRGSLQPPNKV
jgi:hypothetical protein